ncbi:MAG: sulfur carrier protein ThiS [Acidobacteriota bacterium]
MKIKLNNRDENLDGYEDVSVKELLKIKRFTFPMIIVKINGSLVKKEDFENTIIKNGDDVIALHLVSGG